MRIAIAIVLALAACKGKSETVTRASCQASASCEDYDSKTASYIDGRKKECASVKGTWATAACPTENLLGSCKETTATWTRTRNYYVGGGADIAKTKAECGAYGTWIEPPAP